MDLLVLIKGKSSSWQKLEKGENVAKSFVFFIFFLIFFFFYGPNLNRRRLDYQNKNIFNSLDYIKKTIIIYDNLPDLLATVKDNEQDHQGEKQ